MSDELDDALAKAKLAVIGIRPVEIKRVRTEEPRRPMCCCLCGVLHPHGAVEGQNVHLIFRAVEVDGMIWLPAVHGGPGTRCPDPSRETAAWWSDDVKREAWKAEQRKRLSRPTRR